MARTIQQGFAMTLEVRNVGSIKPVSSGTFKNSEGQLIKYDASLQFRTTVIEEIEDEDLGLKEVETHLELKIPCGDSKQVKELNEFLRSMKNSGQVFQLKTTLPKQSDTNVYKAVSTLSASEFMEQNKAKVKK